MNKDRREFIKFTGGVLLTSYIAASPFALVDKAIAQNTFGGTMSGNTKHELPKLAYSYDALEPYIDAKTMELHHSKHHQGYVNGLNKAEEMLAKARAEGDYGMIQLWTKNSAFHGAGHFLHSIFWAVMAPNGKGGGGEPSGKLMEKIKEDFGSFKAFQEQFSKASATVEGSGWGILAYRKADNKLVILQAENHQKLTQWVSAPILCLDVWEHAYYLKYQNRRADYIKEWWNVVNWSEVEKRLKAEMS
jgi:Fe-Mn family superoxide dismutase